MTTLIYSFYNLVLLVLAVPLLLSVLWYYRTRQPWQGFKERWGKWNVQIPSEKMVLWFHAASLGETRALVPLAEAVKKRFPDACLVLTTSTPEALSFGKATGLYQTAALAPMDFPWAVQRVVAAVHPQALILVESEFWPNLLFTVKKAGAKILVVNGRLSPVSARRYRWLGKGSLAFLGAVDCFGMRGPEDAGRLRALGIAQEKIAVTGNLKYDQTLRPLEEKSLEELKKRCAWDKTDKIFVSGSTREGEEEILAEAFVQLRKRHPRLRWVLAPRHLERVLEVEKLLEAHHISNSRYSAQVPCDCLVVDALGVLSSLYAVADVVFVGGSLVAKGGQNLLEPALLSKPILMGPHMDNFRESAELLKSSQGAREVLSGHDLAQESDQLLSDPQSALAMGRRAQETAKSQRGAVEKNLQLLEQLLEKS